MSVGLPQFPTTAPQPGTDYVQSSIYNPFAGNDAKDLNASRGNMYMRKITELAMNRFKWEGLPPEIDPRFLEYTLYMNALAVYFHDDEFDKDMIWRGSMYGWVDYQDNPVQYLVVGNLQYESKTLSVDECVPIWSNYMRMPDWDITHYYAGLLAEFDMSIRMNVINSRHPVILVADSAGRNRLTLENILRDVQEGQPAIGYYDGGLGEDIKDSITSFDLGIKASDLDALQIAKTRAFNECMTFFGIDNANQDKKERLVSNEVDANNSQIVQFRNTALNSRKFAADKINEMFGTSITVEWNEEIPEASDATEQQDDNQEPGNDNG